ncbi:acetyl-/propionyl-coenzyme A carboxylase alpha chain [bacterium BMS3Abin02]|nr:acetyl-/propionyl-coenzyme A carboxylase alpha chain [bacterium BMS3Abin02]
MSPKNPPPRPINALLVANRGEIAVRVLRSAREMGIRTIAVYSELDRDALHTQVADEAWNIGPAPSSESYLDAHRILRVAKETGADAVHPGYGFLAENSDFAQAVMDAGMIWVGPPPEAIIMMGSKITARQAATKAGVSVVPGTTEPLASTEEAFTAAAEFGFPVAVKAAHGGGGKGLRIVHDASELQAAVEGARRESEAYFGSSELYVEKYIEEPRHIEAQIFADDHGHTVFLGERDCSLQRRHQKLIEETPAAGLADRLRKAIGRSAIQIAKACDYRGAGTVEFLVDKEDNFYFLEMNTRLQVEHTVTEMVTGIDLVAEQLRVARGEPLSFTAPKRSGHAIEFRINAEDPAHGFLPNPGHIVDYREPAGFGVRVDSGVTAGSEISRYYDTLIAKLITWGRTREQAIARGKRALREFRIVGVPTTIPAHLRMLENDTFLKGKHHTAFVENSLDFSDLVQSVAPPLAEEEALARRDMTVEVSGRRYTVTFWAPELPTAIGGRPRRKPPKLARAAMLSSDDAGIITAPMQGTIVKVHVEAGDHVRNGDALCVLEAMKMENEVRAPVDGEVIEIKVRPGDTVSPGQIIAIIR